MPTTNYFSFSISTLNNNYSILSLFFLLTLVYKVVYVQVLKTIYLVLSNLYFSKTTIEGVYVI
jgi:hypothetical protein